MDITDFDKMEEEAASRLFEQKYECSKCGGRLFERYSYKHGDYLHCRNCNSNFKPCE